MSEEEKNHGVERSKTIALTDVNSEKVDRWLEQVFAKRVQLSRREFLNWFIEKSPENLSNSDLGAIVERYYDEEAYLRRLVREVKQSKKEGRANQLEFIVRPRKSEPKRDAAPEVIADELNEDESPS